MSKSIAAALLTFALSVPAYAQEPPPKPGSSLLQGLGDFLRDGLSAPRTAADLAREEEKARQAAISPQPPVPEPASEAPPAPDAPPPVVEAPPPPVPPTPAPAQAPVIEPAATPMAPPPARPATPIVVPQPPAAEPIAPAERIAGTATLEQAIRLGGPIELYTRRPATPPGN